ncbi:uncharacterized protein DS421_16g543710 [Arachis hypogaea]|nr:uncharacterized protein DS421_16g543710 [Arachis hypogaea]
MASSSAGSSGFFYYVVLTLVLKMTLSRGGHLKASRNGLIFGRLLRFFFYGFFIFFFTLC